METIPEHIEESHRKLLGTYIFGGSMIASLALLGNYPAAIGMAIATGYSARR